MSNHDPAFPVASGYGNQPNTNEAFQGMDLRTAVAISAMNGEISKSGMPKPAGMAALADLCFQMADAMAVAGAT
jgi:hypothetical protein